MWFIIVQKSQILIYYLTTVKMPAENYNEYREDSSESMQSEIDAAINHAKSDLNDLQSEILWWKKVDFKTPDSINHFYELDKKSGKVIFKLDQVKNYLSDVYKRLSWMKVQKFSEISKESNFTWTILAIQIALKAMKTDPKNPKIYNIWQINWKYDDTTKKAIQQFQADCKLKWQDGKPWKETLWRITKELDNLINNKKLERSEQEVLKTDVTNIIEESINNNWFSWPKQAMVDYILQWNLNTWKNLVTETQIKILADNPSNYKLKYLIEHTDKPLQKCIQEIKNLDNKKWNSYFDKTDRNLWLTDKYTFWHNLTEAQKGTISNVLWKWNSPVTAEMVADSCQNARNVPVEYLLWFMQNDSRVWTMWRWARTHNPWNVWNTNTWTKDWWTWEKWVDACAENLQKRINAYLDAKVQRNGKWFNDFPTPEELATWKSKWGYKFFGIYMSAPSGPKSVASMVKTRVNRLRWN